MKHNLLFLLFFLPLTTVFSQGLIPFKKDSLYGYMDYKGNIVVQPQYQEADFLDIDSLANVKKNNKWSLINQNGIEVLPFVGTRRLEVYPLRNHKGYNYDFSNFVSLSEKKLHFLRTVKISVYEYFILNLKTAKSYGMFKFDYNDYPPFSHSDDTYIPIFQNNFLVAETETHNCTIFDTLTNIIVTDGEQTRILNPRFVSYYQKEQLFLYDTQTKQALKLPYQSIDKTFSDTIFRTSSNNSKQRHLNDKLPFIYFSSIINYRGEILLDSIKSYIHPILPSRFIVYEKDTCFFLDEKGRRVFSETYKNIGYTQNGVFIAQSQDLKYTFIDGNGKLLLPTHFDMLEYNRPSQWDNDSCSRQCYFFKTGEEAGILNLDFTVRIKYKADRVGIYRECSDYLDLYKNKKVGLMDKKGNLIISPIYDEVRLEYKLPFIHLRNDKKVGLADLNGKLIFDPEYDDIKIEEENEKLFFCCKKDGLYRFFDKNLVQLKDFFTHRASFPHPRPLVVESDVNEDIVYNNFGQYVGRYKRNVHCGYVLSDSSYLCFATQDSTIIILKSDGIPLLKNTQKLTKALYYNSLPLGLFTIEENHQLGVINHKGEYIIPLGSQKIGINSHHIDVQKKEKHYLYDLKGTLLIPYALDFVGDLYENKLRVIGLDIPDKTYLYTPFCCEGNLPPVIKHYRNYALINKFGKIIIPFKREYNHFTYVGYNTWAGTKGVGKDKKRIDLLDTLGKVLLKTDFDAIDDIYERKELLTPVFQAKKNGKSGIINRKGKLLIDTFYATSNAIRDSSFIYLTNFKNTRSVFNHEGHIILKDLELVPNPNYYSSGNILLEPLPQNRFLAFLEKQTLLIDKNGSILYTFDTPTVLRLEEDTYQSRIPSYRNSLIEVQQGNDKWYYNFVTLKAYKLGA